MGLERHRPHASVRVAARRAPAEVERPDRLVDGGVDDGQSASADHPRGHMPPVGRHEHVVHRSQGRDRLDDLALLQVHDIHATAILYDRDVDLPAIVADGDVVRPSRERNPVRDRHDVRRHDLQRAVDLVAEVEDAPVRLRRDTVRLRDPLDDLHDLVRGRVDDVHVVAGRVRLDDSHIARLGCRGGSCDDRKRESQCEEARDDQRESRMNMGREKVFHRNLRGSRQSGFKVRWGAHGGPYSAAKRRRDRRGVSTRHDLRHRIRPRSDPGGARPVRPRPHPGGPGGHRGPGRSPPERHPHAGRSGIGPVQPCDRDRWLDARARPGAPQDRPRVGDRGLGAHRSPWRQVRAHARPLPHLRVPLPLSHDHRRRAGLHARVPRARRAGRGAGFEVSDAALLRLDSRGDGHPDGHHHQPGRARRGDEARVRRPGHVLDHPAGVDQSGRGSALSVHCGAGAAAAPLPAP